MNSYQHSITNRERPAILTVLNDYRVTYRMRGRRAVALCPLPDHNEKTPSFTVWPAEDRFYCFGCGRSGDGFDLIAHLSGRPLAEVLKQRNFVPNIDRKRCRHTEELRDQAYARLAQLNRATIKAEQAICANVTDNSPDLMANIFCIRDIVWPLLDDLAGGATDTIKAAIDEARGRRLFDG